MGRQKWKETQRKPLHYNAYSAIREHAAKFRQEMGEPTLISRLADNKMFQKNVQNAQIAVYIEV